MGELRGLVRRLDETGGPLLVARVVLAVIFIWLGFSKMLDPIEFLKEIREYHILPESPPYFLTLTAVVLPPLEVLCGLALLLGVGLRGASLTLLGLLAVFTPAILYRGLSLYAEGGVALCDVKFDCGCGAGEVFLCSKVIENTGLIALALVAVFSRSRKFCLSGPMGARQADEAVPASS